MTEAQIRRQFYASEMGDVRHLRLLQRLVELIAAGQMRRSGEFLMACILLAITLPLIDGEDAKASAVAQLIVQKIQ
jgi:hypothetical protein